MILIYGVSSEPVRNKVEHHHCHEAVISTVSVNWWWLNTLYARVITEESLLFLKWYFPRSDVMVILPPETLHFWETKLYFPV